MDQPKISHAPSKPFGRPIAGWRQRCYIIIFEAETKAGRRFDVLLLWAIVVSVSTVILDSVIQIHNRFGHIFGVMEWLFTFLFSIEYIARLTCVRHPMRYARSFFGIIDLLSVLPSYLAFFIPELSALVDVRLLRLLRVFRVLKIPNYFEEAQILWLALYVARRKIAVFIGTVMILIVILGTIIYVIEGPKNGFTSIPIGMYWAAVTITTTGYGDLVPGTPIGKMLTSIAILTGYGIIAFPTGIMGAHIAYQMFSHSALSTRSCPHCLIEGLTPDANYCHRCGFNLPEFNCHGIKKNSGKNNEEK